MISDIDKEKWTSYFVKTKNSSARKPLLYAIKLFEPDKTIKKAYDLGSGAGNDSLELLKNGYKVLANDYNNNLINHYDEISKKFSNIIFTCDKIENISIENADLINASFSLPFVDKDKFYEVLNKIKIGLKPGGIFCGQLFGKKDEWSHLNLIEKEDIFNLFPNWKIELLNEIEEDKNSADAVLKHWHYFEIVIIK